MLVGMSEVNKLLSQIELGDSAAPRQLLPIVYGELRRLAAAMLAGERPGQTLQPTALVHEAWLRLAGGCHDQSFKSRTHFFAAAAESMRRILVDRARRRSAERHGGKLDRQELLDSDIATVAPADEVIAVNDALDALVAHDSLTAELIKLRYFGGFTLEEAGELLGMSRATAYRSWTYGRAWLKAELNDRDCGQ